MHLLGIEPGSHCLAATNFTTLPNGPYSCFYTFNRKFLGYVNSTAYRNFKFKPDLTLIKATTEPYLQL